MGLQFGGGGSGASTIDGVTGLRQELARGASLANWFRGALSGKKLAFVGDSTSDHLGNASGLKAEMDIWTGAGQPLNGITVTYMGSAGLTASGFNSGSGGAGYTYTDLVAFAPDCVVYSFGINDVRTGSATEANLRTSIDTFLTNLRTSLPNCDVILRMPNSLLTDDPTANSYVTQGAFGSLALAAQDYTDRMYGAYRYFEGRYPNVLVWNAMDSLFGKTCVAYSVNGLMSDQIHPGANEGYASVARHIVTIIAPQPTVETYPLYAPLAGFSRSKARSAVTKNSTSPWLVYPRVLEDTDHYELIAEGTLNQSITSTITRLNFPGARYAEIKAGDLWHFLGDNYVWDTTSTAGFAMSRVSTTVTQAAYTSGQQPGTTAGVNTLVRVYRRKYWHDANVQQYAQNKVIYPGTWRCTFSGGGVNYVELSAYTDDMIAQKRTIQPGDILVAPGKTPYTVPASAGFNNGNNYFQLTNVQDFTSWIGLAGYCISPRPLTIEAQEQGPIRFASRPGVAITATEQDRLLLSRSGRYSRVLGRLNTAPSGGTLVVEVRRNGSVVVTLTFNSGSISVNTITFASSTWYSVKSGDIMTAVATTVNGTPDGLLIAIDV